ncbi:glycosyltransferase family 4 protein [Neobacillus sp. 179-C4.2 HS]|uniref:Glycosyltransferase family 4 protein n=1 Tax=Neobacillus driksii TaxID=3035913 RepID=A0ABV4Z015_9BACI|nr:glycosyltransferase family 4 protein [Neobacillus sp. 179.-C4.2 HS]MDP5196687.1 glycosyltransferase family 4 protein [Neobacillus sp. 179.-C4.2 HS]
MREIKVLFATRNDALTHRGGDTVQMLKTKEFLEKNFPVKIEIALNETDFLEHQDADLVHIFNIQTIDETLRYVELCERYNKKFTFSTIYWDLSHYIYNTFLINTFNYMNINKSSYNYKNLVMNLKKFAGLILNKGDQYGSKSYVEKRRKVLEKADLLLPNSNEELEILEREFGLEGLMEKTIVVPNAVDLKASTDTKLSLDWLNKLENIVLEVGRIEPTKNQASVVKALENHPEIPIVFVGRVHNEKYAEYVKKLANKRGNVHFINQIDHEEIFALYRKAAVHVLPSFRESPGLSSLEALFSGCNIVASSVEYCPVHYYKFDQYGEICNPYDAESVEKAILTALKKDRVKLPESYFEDYSYQRAAELTYKAYEKLLN